MSRGTADLRECPSSMSWYELLTRVDTFDMQREGKEDGTTGEIHAYY
jgi:hypothetical protein